ncbi:uncharacterized protein AB675_303 [Cyphellophora attinorum]|uniref:Uncharacterized protein n=1 Tax=Cyphellophora attinorum TaxID=1664694 RepID=A0A0N0NS40_9EURO|nr:uncharacterized protein AB675_303 [Phialophora attinorum]KPI45559.1 hypothetical protein AB675_303 [Phialophora attinorum]
MAFAYNPDPPAHLHSTTRLTHAQAHTFLKNYLSTADSNPAYRPDAVLTERGPVSNSAGAVTSSDGSGGGDLTLTNLGRVLKGMAGTRVGGAEFKASLEEARSFNKGKRKAPDAAVSATLASAEQRNSNEKRNDGDSNGPSPAKRPRQETRADSNDNDEPIIVEEPTAEEPQPDDAEQGWQDKDDYEMAQDDLVVPEAEADDAQPAVGGNTTSGEMLSLAEEVLIKSVKAGVTTTGRRADVEDSDDGREEAKRRKAGSKKERNKQQNGPKLIPETENAASPEKSPRRTESESAKPSATIDTGKSLDKVERKRMKKLKMDAEKKQRQQERLATKKP